MRSIAAWAEGLGEAAVRPDDYPSRLLRPILYCPRPAIMFGSFNRSGVE